MRVRVLLLVCFVFSLAGATQAGQASGEVPGRVVVTVRDNWGVLPGAVVRLTTAGAVVGRTATADADGRAVFAEVRPGTYRARASMPGFVDSPEVSVEVAAGEERTADLVLSLVQFSSEVTVSTASRREELLLNTADAVALIDRAQIDDAGARSAKDVLLDQAGQGIIVNQGGGQGHVSINGIPNSGVLVLVDGRRVIGKDANGNFNLEDFDMAAVERIEVVRGAGSALYGSDALGGVINIITRSSRPGFSNLFSLRGGEFGDRRVTDTVGWRGSRLGVSATGGYREYDGFDLSKSNPQTIGQPQSVWRTGTLNADARVTNWLIARLVADYSRRSVDNYFFSGATQLATTVYNSPRKITRRGLTPEVEVLASADTSFTVTFNEGKYDRRERQIYINRTVLVDPWIEWNRETKLTGRQTWRAFGQAHYLQAGYESRRETLERASLLFPQSGQRRAHRDVKVGWAQQEFSFGDDLTVSAGFRFDSYSDFGDKWSPKVSGVYALSPSQRVRVSWGEGFRAPFFNELYLSSAVFVGNPHLQPEKSATLTAGYAWASSRVQASADVFRADVENGITFDLGRFPYSYINLREYVSKGTNMSLSVNLPHGFVPQLAYSYTKRENAQGEDVFGLPKHSAFVKLLWADPRLGLRASLRGQIISAAKFDDGTSQMAYQLWNVNVTRRFAQRGPYGVSVFAQLDNMFNKTDIFRLDAQGQPVPGDYQVWAAPRAFSAGVNVDFGR